MSFLVKVGEKKMSPEEALLLQKAMMEVMDKAWAVPKSYGNCTSFQANEYKSIHGYGLEAFRAAMDPHWPVGVDPAMDKKVDAFRQAIGDRGIWICEIFKQYTDHGKSPEGCFCRTMDINGVHALSKNMDGADAGIKVRKFNREEFTSSTTKAMSSEDQSQPRSRNRFPLHNWLDNRQQDRPSDAK